LMVVNFWKKLVVSFAALGSMAANLSAASPCDNVTDKIDDWQFTPSTFDDGFSKVAFGASTSMFGASASMGSPIGLAVGGAKDINNFRQEISENNLPQAADVTYEGLFYDYHFDN